MLSIIGGIFFAISGLFRRFGVHFGCSGYFARKSSGNVDEYAPEELLNPTRSSCVYTTVMSHKITFWNGVGSALNLLPQTRGERSFMYKGRDIASLTTEQALCQDWANVGNGITTAVVTFGPKKASVAKRKRSHQRRIAK
jgi:hypothetical protein